jgi:hypothetical protein
MPKRWIGGALAALVLGLALSPSPAGAAGPSGVYAQVLHAYQTNGSVPACRFSSQQLSSALGSVDTYGQQYYADFIGAIQNALAIRASGACSKTRLTIGVGGGSEGPPLPPSVTSSTASGIPAPMIALGIVAVALALAGGLGVLAGQRGGGAEWRHAWDEARYRAGLRRRRG